MRHGRRDANHSEIRDALRACGCSVTDLGDVGSGCPDLLVGCRGRTVLLEVKVARGRLTEDEEEWARSWRGGRYAVVRTVGEALAAVGLTALPCEGGRPATSPS